MMSMQATIFFVEAKGKLKAIKASDKSYPVYR
jgi:hypothetical protein